MTSFDAEAAWKWTLRIVGLTMLMVLGTADTLTKAEVPYALYVALVGMIGLPSVVGFQRKAP